MSYNDIHKVKYRIPVDEGLVYLAGLGIESLQDMYSVDGITSIYPMMGPFISPLQEVSLNEVMLRLRPVSGGANYSFFHNRGAKDRAVKGHTQSAAMLIDGTRIMSNDYLRCYVMARDNRFAILDHDVSEGTTKIIRPEDEYFPVTYVSEMISLRKYHEGAQFFEQGKMN